MSVYSNGLAVVAIVVAVLNDCAVFAAVPREFAMRMKECSTQYNTTQTDMINAVMKPEDYPTDAFKCVWACIFKKIKLLDGNGMYDVNVAIQNIKKISTGPKLDEGLESARRCVYVNDKPVSDGANGCDRSKLLVDCLAKDLLKS